MSELDDPKTTTAEVREFYSYGCGPQPTWEESQADFDVWLKGHDEAVERAAAEKAYDHAIDMFPMSPDWANRYKDTNPYRAAALGLTAEQEGEKDE